MCYNWIEWHLVSWTSLAIVCLVRMARYSFIHWFLFIHICTIIKRAVIIAMLISNQMPIIRWGFFNWSKIRNSIILKKNSIFFYVSNKKTKEVIDLSVIFIIVNAFIEYIWWLWWYWSKIEIWMNSSLEIKQELNCESALSEWNDEHLQMCMYGQHERSI